ncbi:uncharacterized protein LOC144646374 isoform X3 [Oculina patagonica]
MKNALFMVLLLMSITYLYGNEIEKPQPVAQEMEMQWEIATAKPIKYETYAMRVGNYRKLRKGKRELDYEENER